MTLFLFDIIKSCRNRAPPPSVSVTLMKTTHPNGKTGCREDLMTPNTDRQKRMPIGVGQLNVSMWYDYQGMRRRRMQTVWNDFWRPTSHSRLTCIWGVELFSRELIHSLSLSNTSVAWWVLHTLPHSGDSNSTLARYDFLNLPGWLYIMILPGDVKERPLNRRGEGRSCFHYGKHTLRLDTNNLSLTLGPTMEFKA